MRVRIGSACAGMFLAVTVLSAQTGVRDRGLDLGAPTSAEEEPRTFRFGLDLLYEHDDNVRLGSGDGSLAEAVESDEILRARPSLVIDHRVQDHRFFFEGGAVFREGSDTDLSEENFTANAVVDLNFTSGLSVLVYDRYLDASFDQALFFDLTDPAVLEPGATETESNRLGTRVIYTPKDRLSFEVFYEDKQESFRFGNADLNVDDRDGELLGGRVLVPVSRTWMVYAAAETQEERSEEVFARTFDRERTVAGVRWEGPRRFQLFLEAGHGEVDYLDTAGTEFENDLVFMGGIEAEMSEFSTLRAQVGENSWGETEALFVYDRSPDEDRRFAIYLQQTTQAAFASDLLGRIFQARIAQLVWMSTFYERFDARLEANWLEIDADDGPLTQKDETLSARVRLGYRVGPEWLRVGVQAQWAERTSTDPGSEFDNTRAGVFLSLAN